MTWNTTSRKSHRPLGYRWPACLTANPCNALAERLSPGPFSPIPIYSSPIGRTGASIPSPNTRRGGTCRRHADVRRSSGSPSITVFRSFPGCRHHVVGDPPPSTEPSLQSGTETTISVDRIQGRPSSSRAATADVKGAAADAGLFYPPTRHRSRSVPSEATSRPTRRPLGPVLREVRVTSDYVLGLTVGSRRRFGGGARWDPREGLTRSGIDEALRGSEGTLGGSRASPPFVSFPDRRPPHPGGVLSAMSDAAAPHRHRGRPQPSQLEIMTLPRSVSPRTSSGWTSIGLPALC